MALVPPAERTTAHAFTGSVYSVQVHSPWALAVLDAASQSALCHVSIIEGGASRLNTARRNAVRSPGGNGSFERAWLPNGAVYLRWPHLFEFIVSRDGREIVARQLKDGALESFQAHLLGQVLSFALIKQGFDPFHATAATVGGRAVAFLGDSGYGKSTLAAAFLRTGHTLLTDDVLVLTATPSGFLAHPGPARIKLFPEVAAWVRQDRTTVTPLTPATTKLLIPLERGQWCRTPVPLAAMYVLSSSRTAGRRNRVAIRRLTGRRACVALLRNAFNVGVTDRVRLAHQIDLVTTIPRWVPIKLVAFPRTLDSLSAASHAILADLESGC